MHHFVFFKLATSSIRAKKESLRTLQHIGTFLLMCRDEQNGIGMGWLKRLSTFNRNVNRAVLNYYFINPVVNSHVTDPGQSLINENFTVASIGKSTIKWYNTVLFEMIQVPECRYLLKVPKPYYNG